MAVIYARVDFQAYQHETNFNGKFKKFEEGKTW